ncbi:lamin tail domain-containing protein, partial [uncultured Trichococcus sp.]|uniref:lamin tail domain-containing protein n=1 Tax=uncultured Trichococcus sp. TaxID=189665 RepID=UPI0025914EAB
MASEGDAGLNQPPVIQHMPVSQGNENEDLLITANITDPDDSVTAAVYYKTASQSAFTAIPMTEESDAGNYSAVIPKEAITEPELQYYIQANDTTNTVKTDTYTVAFEPSSFDNSKVPALLITELVPDSSNFAGADAYEFIEIYNNTNRPIALKDYQILYRYTDSNTDDAVWEIPNEAVIPPKQTMVFWIMNGKNNSLTVD